jgi:hypothetical protein
MIKHATVSNIVVMIIALALGMSTAYAQATRTWVSGVGDDANPCSRTAPCKTFAGAISKTATGGEIDALDPGGYGAVTITKSITIDGGEGQVGSILASSTYGITINTTGPSDVVTIRNLEISGAPPASPGLDGIRILAGANVHLEHVKINSFSLDGVNVNAAASVDLTMRDCTITDITHAGVNLTTSTGTASAELSNVRIYNAHPGIRGGTNSVATVANSDLSFNAIAIRQVAAGSSINVTNSQMNSNGTALQSFAGSSIRAASNTMAQNGTAVNPNGGTISSDGSNLPLNNTSDGAFNGTITNF